MLCAARVGLFAVAVAALAGGCISGGRFSAMPGWEKRLAFHPTNVVELSVVGVNLCDPRHPEFASGSPTQPEIPRSVHGQVTWRF